MSIEHNHSAVIQEESYYPFGMSQHYSYQRELSKEQRHTYNGKESITDLDLGWLDFGARMYQADLGRWFNVDPMAEKYYDMTPYKYGLNNPVAYTDPNGMTEVYGVEMDLGATGSVQNVFSAFSSENADEKKKEGCDPCAENNTDEKVPTAKERIGVGKGSGLKNKDDSEWSAHLATAGVLALSDGPEPFVMDVVALGYLSVVAITTLKINDISEPFPGPWSYTQPDPTKTLPKSFHKSPLGNRFPNNNPYVSYWVKAVLYGTGVLELGNQLHINSLDFQKVFDDYRDFVDDINYETTKFMNDFKSGIKGGTWYPGR